MRARWVAGLSAFVMLGFAMPAAAQDPKVDLPWRRAQGEFEPIWSALTCLKTGWNWEAQRMARELLVQDKDRALPYLLLALATRDESNRAARYCWQAVERRAQATRAEQMLIDAYQHLYFGVERQPELVDANFAKPPARSAQVELVRRLKVLAALQQAVTQRASAPDPLWRDVTTELFKLEQGLLDEARNVGVSEGLVASNHRYLRLQRAMPFLVPGYQRALQASGGNEHLARLPRHPQHPPTTRIVTPFANMWATPPDGAPNSEFWQPSLAPGFELPRGVGGRASYADYQGKPVLVVFFLGFGCAHCVAQLKDLDPRAAKFRAAGIEVVSIGTDDLNQVRAARQAADENGVDPLHFDVLCDPKGEVFKRWGVWDEFDNEALHGSFLVDGKGRILWQDISKRPFEESDWLLEESRRLLKAWL